MCVAIVEKDIYSYIFSKTPSRKFISYDDMAIVKYKLYQEITRNAKENPYYSYVYFDQSHNLDASDNPVIMRREKKGVRMFGNLGPSIAQTIENQYDSKVTDALQAAIACIGR